MDEHAWEAAITDAESVFGVRITVHDLIGALRDADGRPLLPPERQSHRGHPACAIGFDDRCIAHCRRSVNATVAAERLPLLHRCWKGLHEVAVPIHRGGRHVLTLFAGPWRQAENDAEAITPLSSITAIYAQLAMVDSRPTAAIGRMLQLLGEALLARLDGEQHDEPTSRRAAIVTFFRYHDPAGDELGDLAMRLGLSRSRTSRLVGETLGRSFSEAQMSTRIERAKSLLLSTSLTAASIAERSGFVDPFHFNRVFRRLVGTTPGRFRRHPQATYSTGQVPLLPEPGLSDSSLRQAPGLVPTPRLKTR